MDYSIIIPHRNIPNLLMRCLTSIPVREDVQVIVIDDNSDNAESYLEQYPALSRPYLEFVRTTEGKGAGYARNVGLDRAIGKWIIFADADDFFTDGFDQILDEYKDADEDLLFFRSKWVLSDDVTQPSPNHNWIDPIIDRSISSGDEMELRCCIPNPWGRFFKREFIVSHEFRFHETHCANDMFFVISASVNSPSIRVVDKVLYAYTFRLGSLSLRLSKDKDEEDLEIRIKEALYTQKVILTSPYRPKNLPGIGFLSIALHTNRRLFKKYFIPALETGLSPWEVMTGLRYKEQGLFKKIWVYIYCTHLLLRKNFERNIS